MYLQIATAALCFLAGLACFAAMRDVKQQILIVARRLTGVTLLSATVYLLFTTKTHLNPPLCYFLALLALAQLLFAMYAVLDPALLARLLEHPRHKAPDATHA